MEQMSPDMIREVSKRATCLYTSEEVQRAITHMASRISEQLSDTNPVVLCVMIGGVVPTGMLLTQLDFPLQVDYVHATRYKNNLVGDELEWLVRPTVNLRDRTVLIVDDILDGGITLSKIADYCKAQNAMAVKTAVLVDKQTQRAPGTIQQADFTGTSVEDRFIFGFGMDYKRYLRNAPGIFAVGKEDEA